MLVDQCPDSLNTYQSHLQPVYFCEREFEMPVVVKAMALLLLGSNEP